MLKARGANSTWHRRRVMTSSLVTRNKTQPGDAINHKLLKFGKWNQLMKSKGANWREFATKELGSRTSTHKRINKHSDTHARTHSEHLRFLHDAKWVAKPGSSCILCECSILWPISGKKTFQTYLYCTGRQKREHVFCVRIRFTLTRFRISSCLGELCEMVTRWQCYGCKSHLLHCHLQRYCLQLRLLSHPCLVSPRPGSIKHSTLSFFPLFNYSILIPQNAERTKPLVLQEHWMSTANNDMD